MGIMPRGSKPKQYPAEMVLKVSELYLSGMTQCEIGERLGVSQKVIWKLMVRHGLKARVAAKRDQSGEKNSSWKGDLAGYHAFHRRLYAARGKPTKCEVCGCDDPQKNYDYANLSGRYQDMEDFMPMCRSCHWKYDEKIFNIKHMRKEGCHEKA